MAAGYVAVVLAYIALMLLVTRLGRKLLMNGDCVSNLYTALLCCVWFCASLLGAYLCCGLAPVPPYGPLILPLVLAGLSGAVVRRSTSELPGQQSISATAGVGVMILAGTCGALYLRHTL